MKKVFPRRNGLVGLIIVVMVMAFLMSVGTSNTLIVQSERKAEGTRGSYKRAFYAAISGLHFVIMQLRSDAAEPWVTNDRLFFTFDVNCTTAHHRRIIGGTVLNDFWDQQDKFY